MKETGEEKNLYSIFAKKIENFNGRRSYIVFFSKTIENSDERRSYIVFFAKKNDLFKEENHLEEAGKENKYFCQKEIERAEKLYCFFCKKN